MMDEQWGHFLVGIRVQYGSLGAGIGYPLWTVVSRELPRCSVAASLAEAELEEVRLAGASGCLKSPL